MNPIRDVPQVFEPTPVALDADAVKILPRQADRPPQTEFDAITLFRVIDSANTFLEDKFRPGSNQLLSQLQETPAICIYRSLFVLFNLHKQLLSIIDGMSASHK
jgi:hypothetical protein